MDKSILISGKAGNYTASFKYIGECGVVVGRKCMTELRECVWKLSDDLPNNEKNQYWTVYW